MAKPTLYKPEYAKLARNYCVLGANQDDMAAFFGTTDRTIRTWKKKHPEFAAAIEEGSRFANAKVIGSLYDQCLKGDTTAIIWYTKNKMGWRDRIDHVAAIGIDSIGNLLAAIEGTALKPKE